MISTRSRGLACAALVALSACSVPPTGVRQFGAMRAVMRDGLTEPRVALGGKTARSDAYAVGALAGLEGEVTVCAGATWVARVGSDGPVITGPQPVAGDRATLLTVAHVEAWVQMIVEAPCEGAALEALIERTGRAAGVDTSQPFPFRLEGAADAIAIHVINGYCPLADQPDDRASIEALPWRWQRDDAVDIVVVGFYAPNAAGVMTHHGSAVHAHAIIDSADGVVTGHVDHLVARRGMTLWVPAPGWR